MMTAIRTMSATPTMATTKALRKLDSFCSCSFFPTMRFCWNAAAICCDRRARASSSVS